MKIIISYLLILTLTLSFGSVFAASLPEQESPTAETIIVPDSTNMEISSIQGIDANNALLGMEKIVNNAKSAVVYEANSETLMYAWNPDVQMYPASLVKIMTVFLAIKEADLDELVTVSQEAVSAVPGDAVSAKLLPGEKLSVRDLLYCILMSSASDACVVLAEHIGGSEAEFVKMMNQSAAELGCTGTNFTNSHGLHDDDQFSTARDSARILAEAIQNETFRQIFTADDYTVEKTNLSEIRKLSGGNYMKDTTSKLYYDSRVIGGRTGVTNDGRRCLATAAEKNGMQLISVVMGSESVYQDDGYSAISIGGYRETTKLLDVCLDGYKLVQLLYENQSIRQIPVPSGNCDLVIGPKISLASVLPATIATADLVYRYTDKPISLPVRSGTHVSDLQIWHGTMCVAQAEMYALNSVMAKDQHSQDLVENNTDDSVPVLWIFIGLIVIGGAFLYIRYYKRIRIFLKRKRNRRHSRDRRRNH